MSFLLGFLVAAGLGILVLFLWFWPVEGTTEGGTAVATAIVEPWTPSPTPVIAIQPPVTATSYVIATP